MAIVNAAENPSLATAVRGYDRAAVDEVIARETARMRDLEARAAQLEREIGTLRGSRSMPDPRAKVQHALDTIGAGWDEAIRITGAAEYAAAQDRSHAQHRVSAGMATLEEQCAAAERAADDAAVRMVAAAADQAARLLEHAASEHDRAAEAALALARAAEDRAKEVAVQFADKLREVEEQQGGRVAARFNEAERDLAAAQAELAQAERDAQEMEAQARAMREEILAAARAAAEELFAAAGEEVRRRQGENEEAMAELGRLLIATGGQLGGAPIAPVAAPSPRHDDLQWLQSRSA